MNTRDWLSYTKLFAFLTLTLISCEKEAVNNNNTIKDLRDGNVYNTLTIGNQVWMARNLNYNPDNGSWAYANNSDNAVIYGRLYNWETACKVCPEGWHLPSETEWAELIEYLGGNSFAGGKMKEAGTNHWASPNLGATNESGLTALPGGYRDFQAPFLFRDLGESAIFWSSTEYDSSMAYTRGLYYAYSQVNGNPLEKDWGYSVRCIKDD